MINDDQHHPSHHHAWIIRGGMFFVGGGVNSGRGVKWSEFSLWAHTVSHID